jgi:hypothetical protein
MLNQPIPLDVELTIAGHIRAGHLSQLAIANLCGVAKSTVWKIKGRMPAEPVLQSDKKVGATNWEEWADWIQDGQKLRKKATNSQHTAAIALGDGTRPAILIQLGDLHMGSWGVDYALLKTITQEIEQTDGLYVALMGDLVEMAIKMRSVLEVMGQVLPPEQQLAFLESWLEKIMPKVAFSCWCNHAVEREEKASGISSIKNLLAKRSVYFNGIGHPDVSVGDQVYKFSVSHKFRGGSMFDATAGPKRYMRMEAHDREIALQGDLHRPAISSYVEGGKQKLAITSGTLQLNSGYAQRYFSLKTFPVFPCIVLRHDRHEALPFWNLQAALDYVNGAK